MVTRINRFFKTISLILQLFYWHFLEILWLFIFLVFYKISFSFFFSFFNFSNYYPTKKMINVNPTIFQHYSSFLSAVDFPSWKKTLTACQTFSCGIVTKQITARNACQSTLKDMKVVRKVKLLLKAQTISWD